MIPNARRRPAMAMVLLAAVVALPACERTTPPEAPVANPPPAAQPVVLHYEIDGMHCSGCVAAIESKVSELPGISRCTVDLESRRALVEASSADRDAAIRAAIERLGYTLRAP